MSEASSVSEVRVWGPKMRGNEKWAATFLNQKFPQPGANIRLCIIRTNCLWFVCNNPKEKVVLTAHCDTAVSGAQWASLLNFLCRLWFWTPSKVVWRERVESESILVLSDARRWSVTLFDMKILGHKDAPSLPGCFWIVTFWCLSRCRKWQWTWGQKYKSWWGYSEAGSSRCG